STPRSGPPRPCRRPSGPREASGPVEVGEGRAAVAHPGATAEEVVARLVARLAGAWRPGHPPPGRGPGRAPPAAPFGLPGPSTLCVGRKVPEAARACSSAKVTGPSFCRLSGAWNQPLPSGGDAGAGPSELARGLIDVHSFL